MFGVSKHDVLILKLNKTKKRKQEESRKKQGEARKERTRLLIATLGWPWLTMLDHGWPVLTTAGHG